MLLVITTIAIASISALIKLDEVEYEKAMKECEEIDWNEYYANNN